MAARAPEAVDVAALKAAILASPYSISEVARAAGKTGIGGYEYARRVLNGTVSASPTARALAAAFGRLCVEARLEGAAT